MRFSIIIPAYNSGRFIRDCLEGISNLDYPGEQYEVIVVDGGSVDGTQRIIDSYLNVKRIESPNLSIANNRNLGAKQAKGAVLVFLDSDCIVVENLLKKADEYLQTVDCCGGFCKPLPFHSWVSKTWLAMECKREGLVRWMATGTLIVNKEVFFEVGGFSEDLVTGEDVDFGHKLTDKGYRIYNDPKIGSFHLGQTENLLDFFHKEMWRGKSLLRSLLNRKARTVNWLFSFLIIGYFILICSFLLCSVLSYWQTAGFLLFCLLIVPFMIALKNTLKTGKWSEYAKACLLILVFLIARSMSIIRSS